MNQTSPVLLRAPPVQADGSGSSKEEGTLSSLASKNEVNRNTRTDWRESKGRYHSFFLSCATKKRSWKLGNPESYLQLWPGFQGDISQVVFHLWSSAQGPDLPFVKWSRTSYSESVIIKWGLCLSRLWPANCSVNPQATSLTAWPNGWVL